MNSPNLNYREIAKSVIEKYTHPQEGLILNPEELCKAFLDKVKEEEGAGVVASGDSPVPLFLSPQPCPKCAELEAERDALAMRIGQFDDHITTVGHYLGAVCGGVDVGTNIPGSTAFEIIKKIKEIEQRRDELFVKASKMLESLEEINKTIFGETILLGSPEYFNIRELATADRSFQEYVVERIKSDKPK